MQRTHLQAGLFIAGTDTGVGKTRVCAGIAELLRRDLVPVRLWKPVQTGTAAGDPDSDGSRLARGSGVRERDIVTYSFPDALAPWMAASRSGAEIDYDRLLDEGRERLAQGGFLLVEGAGGLAVPLTPFRHVAHLAADLALPMLLVARPGLGTVNHTVLSVAFARQLGITVAGVVLNGAHREQQQHIEENRQMIEQFADVPVAGILPWLPGEEGEDGWLHRWSRYIDTEVRWREVVGSATAPWK